MILTPADWHHLPPADPCHGYLASKRLKPGNLRQSGDWLVAPLTDMSGNVCNLQLIDSAGFKRFLPDLPVKGLCYRCGPRESYRIYVTEGIANAMTAHQWRFGACACVAALMKSQLIETGRRLRQVHHDSRLVLVADNDSDGREPFDGLRIGLAAADVFDECLAAREIGDINDIYVTREGE